MFSYLNPLPSLPHYNGPYRVAITDYEIPVSEILSTSTVPNPDITTIKFRIYYPTRNDTVSKEPVYWLPNPQNQWNDAFAAFLGANPRWSPVVSKLWSLTNYIKMPVVRDGPLLPPPKPDGHPVCFFSHGLGGNTNIYSSIVGSLASCGVVTIVPEHRDGSSPIALIRNAAGDIETTIPYQKLSHNPDPAVLNMRNAQLRIRLWELELMYTTIQHMNGGGTFTNYAQDRKEPIQNFKEQLNLQPGKVTWAGHSFGAATITQFIKSIFYHQHLPQIKRLSRSTSSWDRTPLYQTQSDSDLVKQITPESPVALLDIWTMPLRGESTSWLWERPMPCYAREPKPGSKTSTVAMISGEFYGYEGILNRTRALLSEQPATAIELIESGNEQHAQLLPPTVTPTSSKLDQTSVTAPIAEISKQDESSTTTSSSSPHSSTTTSPSSTDPPSPTSSQSSFDPLSTASIPPTSAELESTCPPKLFHIPQSAHLSQSDFGPLFPNLTKYAMKALDPHKTIEMNVRAILGVMRNAGLQVESLRVVGRVATADDLEEYILDENESTAKPRSISEKESERRRKEAERWAKVPLVQC